VVEVRGDGEFVTFDVPQTADTSSTPSPAAALASLLRQPACASNLALSQPGRCSSSCGNGTSPARVNDGDLRQYSPYVWQACENDPRPWWSVQLPRSMRNPYVRIFVGECCAQSFRHTVVVHIGETVNADQCTTFVVDDGSAVGAICEGEGEWVTISAPSSFALAEVQVCDADELNVLLRQPLTSAIDVSAGVLDIGDSGAEVEQLAPNLLALVAPGRDAAWRYSATQSADWWPLVLGVSSVGGVVLLLAIACMPRKVCVRRTFARVSYSDGLESPTTREDDDIFAEDDELEERPDFVPSGVVPVTFEWSDGTTISSNVSLAGVTQMEHIFAAVRTAAKKALGGGPVEHLSLQFMNAKGQFEEAWWDPILREGSELQLVARSRKWRVLILGEGVDILPSATSDELVAVAL